MQTEKLDVRTSCCSKIVREKTFGRDTKTLIKETCLCCREHVRFLICERLSWQFPLFHLKVLFFQTTYNFKANEVGDNGEN